jgi:L-ascorbate metabolism protein UlaG (beta-lactamase superfamily)
VNDRANRLGFSPSVKIQLATSVDTLMGEIQPFLSKIQSYIQTGNTFDRSVGAALKAHPTMDRYFEFFPRRKTQPFKVNAELIYPKYRFKFAAVLDERSRSRLILSQGHTGSIAALGLLGRIGSAGIGEIERRKSTTPFEQKALKALDHQGILLPKKFATQRMQNKMLAQGPGIYRLQHACTLFRSKTTSIIVDPHFHSSFTPDGLEQNFEVSDLGGRTDAILLTHSHADHYDLPSLMMLSRDTLIVVPFVPKATLVCPSMVEQLTSLGFTNVLAPAWNSEAIKVGDFEIHAMPFYGEQATATEVPHYADVWNHGNTYVVKSANETAWLLSDSGSDCRGNMFEVATRIAKKFGRIDAILGSLRRFYYTGPFYLDMGRTWLTLSPEQMARPRLKGESLTLGVEGLVQICDITGAHFVLPYANWWAPIGQHASDDLENIRDLKAGLKSLKFKTSLYQWKIGERFALNFDLQK